MMPSDFAARPDPVIQEISRRCKPQPMRGSAHSAAPKVLTEDPTPDSIPYCLRMVETSQTRADEWPELVPWKRAYDWMRTGLHFATQGPSGPACHLNSGAGGTVETTS